MMKTITSTSDEKVSLEEETKSEEPIIQVNKPLAGPLKEPPISPEQPRDLAASGEKWDKIIRGIVYVLTFLLPILFTPWTFEPLEFSKQMILLVLTSSALIAWLLKVLVLRSAKIVKTPLDLPIGILLLVYLLASLFSVDLVASFLGFYGSFSGNFFQVLFLVLFYYLVINSFETTGQVKRLFKVFYFSVFLALAYAVLQFFGLFVVHLPFAKINNFNTVGGLLMLSLFSAVAVVVSLMFRTKSWIWKILQIAVVLCAFLVLITVNFLYAWVALLAGLLVYLILRIGLSESFSIKDAVVPLVLVIIVGSILVLQFVLPFVSLRSILSLNLQTEVRLDYQTAAPVLKGLVSTRPILGSGPNTFLYAFSQHRDKNFNLSPFWNVRFDKAPSEAAEYLIGSGILGFLAFEILSLIFIVYGFLFLLRHRKHESWNLALAVFAGFGTLWFAHWFFFFNSIVAFAFWLLMAGFIALSKVAAGETIKAYDFSFAQSPRRTVSVVTAVSLSLVLVIVFLFFAAAVYAADIFFRQGLVATSKAETYDQAQTDFERAIRLNRFRPDYYLTYGEFLFLRINQELAKKNPNLRDIQDWLSRSIATSRVAVNLSPANWTAWERLATLYTSARPLVAGVDKFIIDSLTKATENDPLNPILFVELGQIYRLAARTLDPAILGTGADGDSDKLSDEQERVLGSDPADPDSNGNSVLDGDEVLSGLNPSGSGSLSDSFLSQYVKSDPQSLLRAESSFRKAMELKDDYALAYYQLVLTLEQEQKIDQAITELEKALQKFPGNLTIKFELGRLYFNTGRIDQAARQFQEIVAMSPNYSNAHFSLALSYERLGKTKKALDEYRKVLELNPGNVALETKIAELEQKLILESSPPKKRGKK